MQKAVGKVVCIGKPSERVPWVRNKKERIIKEVY